MAGGPVRLGVRDAIAEILNRQQQSRMPAPSSEGPATSSSPIDPLEANRIPYGGFFDHSLASPADIGGLIEINWQAKRDRQQWEKREGVPWPKTEEGRNYDRHHITPKAKGGGLGIDNVTPMHPLEHRKLHMENGEFREWGSWSKKGLKGPIVRGLGLLGIIPNITGLLSGRIRTDTFDNFTSDMLGIPSEEDRQKAFEAQQRMLNPKWKPGDPILM